MCTPVQEPEQPVAATPSDALAPIDVEALLARSLNDPAFAVKILGMFQRRTLDDVKRLRDLVSASEPEGAQRLAHDLKSVASHIAAGNLRNIAFELEQTGSRRDLAFISARLQKLDDEIRKCLSFVPGVMKRLGDENPSKIES
jgi:HPt (histidine-containing phosphotransfer) domain-containing protein